MTRPALARAAGAIGLVVVALGCFGKSPIPAYYTLASGRGAPVAKLPELGLAVGPIEFPRYLDRPEIVSRDGSNGLVLANAHRWGGSLRNDVLRVVADELGALLGTPRVVIHPTEPRYPLDYRVLLDVRELDGVLGQPVVLRVRWTIVSGKDGKAVAVEESRIESATASASRSAYVDAQSAALGTVTREIAERIASLAH